MKDKIVVITGGASGIGLALAKELARDNTVVSIDRNPSKIAALTASLPKVTSIRADLTVSSELDAALLTIEEMFGKIDVLINNAGVGGLFDVVHMTEAEMMRIVEAQLAVNYIAPLLLTKKALPLLQKANDPIVVNTSTGLVYTPMATVGSYCASKSALHFITMALRHQLAPLRIRVVEAVPPSVDTELNLAKAGDKMSPETFAKVFLAKLPKGGDVVNVGQSAALEKMSRLFPSMMFRLMNKS